MLQNEGDCIRIFSVRFHKVGDIIILNPWHVFNWLRATWYAPPEGKANDEGCMNENTVRVHIKWGVLTLQQTLEIKANHYACSN